MNETGGSAVSKSAGVNFYKHILRYKNPSNKPYPIVNLIGHRGSASMSVRNIAKNPGELKNLFLLNPDVFIVSGDNVTLSNKHSAFSERKVNSQKTTVVYSTQDISTENKSVKNDIKDVQIQLDSIIPWKSDNTGTEKEALVVDIVDAVEFYYNKLSSKCKSNSFPLGRLIGYRNLACPEIQRVAKNPKDLKAFLEKFPTLFTVSKLCVAIPQAVLVKELCVLYYFNKLAELSKDKEISFDKLYNTNAESNTVVPDCVPATIKSSADLKNFLSAFSNIFQIRDDYICIVPDVFIESTKEHIIHRISRAIIQEEVMNSSNLSSLKLLLSLSSNEQKKCQTNLNKNHDILVSSSDRNPENCRQAVEFFLEKLWQYGLCRVISINDLFKFKSEASQEIQSVCGVNIQEFRTFLTRYPESFIVTCENVLARRNIPMKKWCPPSTIIEEPTCSVIVNFFKSFTEDGNPVKIEKLHSNVGKCFFKSDGRPFFESSQQLEDFLKMFPQFFYTYNNHVVNIIYGQKDANKNISGKTSKESKLVNEKCVSTNDNDSLTSDTNVFKKGILGGRIVENLRVDAVEGKTVLNADLKNRNSLNWKDEVLLKTKVVDSLKLCQEITDKILNEDKLIAVDCEGYNLGMYGKMSLIQIARPCGQVFVFDIFQNPMFINSGGLKEIIESSQILKVMHDCKNDYANLLHEFQVKLKNIFDTRVAHYVISFPGRKPKTYPPISFNVICKKYGAPINIEKDNFKDVYKYDPAFWLRRPLSKDMLAYAALDVACLVPHVYNAMRLKCVGLLSKIIDLSEVHSRTTS